MRLAHGSRNLLDLLTITNQCIFCKSCFASKANARYHRQRAVKHLRCLPNRSFVSQVPIAPDSLLCPICDFQGSKLEELTAHLLSHWPGAKPATVYKDGGAHSGRSSSSKKTQSRGGGSSHGGRRRSQRFQRHRGAGSQGVQRKRQRQRQLGQQQARDYDNGDGQAALVPRRVHQPAGGNYCQNLASPQKVSSHGSRQVGRTEISREGSISNQGGVGTASHGTTTHLCGTGSAQLSQGHPHRGYPTTYTTLGHDQVAGGQQPHRVCQANSDAEDFQNLRGALQGEVSLPESTRQSLSMLVFPKGGRTGKGGQSSKGKVGKGGAKVSGEEVSSVQESPMRTQRGCQL